MFQILIMKKIFYSINFVFINKNNFKEINKLPKKNIVNDKSIFKNNQKHKTQSINK